MDPERERGGAVATWGGRRGARYDRWWVLSHLGASSRTQLLSNKHFQQMVRLVRYPQLGNARGRFS